MAYQLTGTIKTIFDTRAFASGFSKREFVVTSEDKFPQDIAFECVKEKAALLDDVSPGQRVTVHFNINGREYNERYFVNLSVWRVDAADQGGPAQAHAEPEDTTDYGQDEPPF